MRAEPERVYDGIATAEGLEGWFTTGARVDARPGGHIHFRWKDWGPDRVSLESDGPVLEAVRPRRFVFQWTPKPAAKYRTTVEIDFESVEGGTVVRLREHGYPDTPAARRALLDCACGWGEALTLWKLYVERGVRY